MGHHMEQTRNRRVHWSSNVKAAVIHGQVHDEGGPATAPTWPYVKNSKVAAKVMNMET